jgi:hypothetical protein
MPTRKLRLAKETLSALDTGELRSVVAGNSLLPCLLPAWEYTYSPDCVNDITFEFCPTPTIPVEQCV